MRRQLLRLGLDSLPKILIDLRKHLIRPGSDRLLRGTQVPGHVSHEIILLALLPTKDLPQHSRLHEILIRDRQLLRHRCASPFLVFLAGLDGLVGHITVGGGVVGVGAVVAVDGHNAVTLVGVEGAEGSVNRNLLVVDSKAVAVGVRVGEEAGLEDRVSGGFDAGDHVRGREGNLLDFGKVVLCVLIEGEFAEGSERNVLLGPDFGQIEDVPAELFSLFRREDLQIAGPRRIVAILNAIEEVLGVPIWIIGGHFARFGVVKCFAALVGLAVDLHVVEGTVGFGKLVSVT